ncbi:MAG: DNA primase [Clostridium sp.]|nr:DNA primase [Clostridium sp.]MCM1172731.1 DNA primase [Clostridium sp.]
MYYSDDIIEEVRSRNDIVDVIGGYVSLKKQGNSYSACCPFHHEKTPSFHVSRDKQLYHCFGCGASGNVFTFVREYENMGFVEAMKLLADRSGMTLPEYELSPKQKEQENYRTELKELNRTAAAYFHYLLTKTEHGKKALDYLHNRGFTDDTITAFAMGYSDIYNDDLYKYLKNKGYTDRQMVDAGLVDVYEDRGANDKFWNRVMVPILDINGKVIAFGGRVLGDGKPKYVNTKETAVFDKSRNLFAMNIARRSKRRGIIICEGYMDVIAMHQAGFDNAVASLGTAFTIGQANIIKRYTDEAYLAYDSDGAGTNATMKAIGIMRSVGITTRVIDMKPYKDPDEFIKNMGREAYEERILNASTGIMFEVACLAGNYNLKDPEEKTKFTKEAAKRISAIEEVVTRHSYIETVAEQYRLDADGFKSMVTKYGTLGIKEMEITNSVPRRTTQKQDDTNMPERLLLTWLVNDTGLFDVLSGIISEEDFVAEDYRAVADILFSQYRDTGQVKPAAIVDMFPDMDKQRLVASILQTELAFDMSLEEREKAVNDVVKRTKLAKIDYDMSMCMDDMARLQELIKAKAKIAKLHISLKSG